MMLSSTQTYVHFADDGVATTLPGGAGFKSLSEAELARYGQGWLISEHKFTVDWANWEMHPNGDEFVYRTCA
ncbi:MAG: hypothetical protein JO269_12445 [Burkholderiaceae bacterium]|nr:hypothetical protein [Burkholderiaceae bacterium]